MGTIENLQEELDCVRCPPTSPPRYANTGGGRNQRTRTANRSMRPRN